nr:TIM barrel protein [Candidatus Sigynarchaeota archaeon]
MNIYFRPRGILKMLFSTTITNPNIMNTSLDRILNILIEAGFDAVDLPGEPDLFPLATLKQAMNVYSGRIDVAEITACINPTRDLMNPDKIVRRKAVDYVKYCIDVASELGVNLTHACFITTPVILKRTGNAVLERNAIDSLKELARYAIDSGVKLMLEPLFSGDNTIVKTARDATALFS